MKKKLLGLLVVVGLALAACGQQGGAKETVVETAPTQQENGNVVETATNGKKVKIGITQLMEHPSLDQARTGFEEGLKELGIDATIDYQNAQGDIPNSNTIAQRFANDGVDMIFAISTPSAQSAQQVTTEVPILFTAVTDAVEAGLVKTNEAPGANITGTSDAAPVKEQLRILQEIDPTVKKVGILFNTSEANSEVQIVQAKAAAQELGMTIETKGISNLNDLPQAIESLFPAVDGLYLITDNSIASSVKLVNDKLIEYKLPSSSAFDSAITEGALISNGLSYYELGKQSASLAKKILVEGVNPSEVPVETATTTTVTYNVKTAEALGYDTSKEPFASATPVQ